MFIISAISMLLRFLTLSEAPLAEKENLMVEFSFTINNEPISLNETVYSSSLKDSLTIKKLKFYISEIEFNQNTPGKQPYFLLDASKPESLNLPIFKVSDLETISFNLGVDSLTNSNGAHGGDLDPMNGMYWSWQSGYINFKMEGSSPKCVSNNQEFTFHLGGYSGGENALQRVTLPVLNQQGNLKIILPIDDLLNSINLEEGSRIMSPSLKAVKISEVVADTFLLAQ